MREPLLATKGPPLATKFVTGERLPKVGNPPNKNSLRELRHPSSRCALIGAKERIGSDFRAWTRKTMVSFQPTGYVQLP